MIQCAAINRRFGIYEICRWRRHRKTDLPELFLDPWSRGNYFRACLIVVIYIEERCLCDLLGQTVNGIWIEWISCSLQSFDQFFWCYSITESDSCEGECFRECPYNTDILVLTDEWYAGFIILLESNICLINDYYGIGICFGYSGTVSNSDRSGCRSVRIRENNSAVGNANIIVRIESEIFLQRDSNSSYVVKLWKYRVKTVTVIRHQNRESCQCLLLKECLEADGEDLIWTVSAENVGFGYAVKFSCSLNDISWIGVRIKS